MSRADRLAASQQECVTNRQSLLGWKERWEADLFFLSTGALGERGSRKIFGLKHWHNLDCCGGKAKLYPVLGLCSTSQHNNKATDWEIPLSPSTMCFGLFFFFCVCVSELVPGGVQLELQHWGGVLRKYENITEWERGVLDIRLQFEALW